MLSRFPLSVEKARRSPHEFVRQAWPVLEPETPFVKRRKPRTDLSMDRGIASDLIDSFVPPERQQRMLI